MLLAGGRALQVAQRVDVGAALDAAEQIPQLLLPALAVAGLDAPVDAELVGTLQLHPNHADERAVVLDADRQFVGIERRDGQTHQPRRLFRVLARGREQVGHGRAEGLDAGVHAALRR